MPHIVPFALTTLTALGLSALAAAAPETRLLRRPTVSGNQVAFAYASDLWIVAREGGRARRLTTTPTIETDPRFSPDGSRIAFTATVGGNTDVYVMPSAGGAPKRLTYHPGLDLVRGWTPDGKRVIFASSRNTAPTPIVSSYVRLWTVSLEGGLPDMLPMPRAYSAALSSDGQYAAYEEFAVEFETREAQTQSAQWRRYRGGRTHPIRVMDLAKHSEERLPWQNSVDSDPMWIGGTIYFLTDRNGAVNLFSYDTGTRELEQLTRHDDDIMNASAGADAVVYEQAGFIHLFDIRNGQSRRLRIEAAGEFAWAQPQTRKVDDMIRNVAISADGAQLAIEARGEIFKAPTHRQGHAGDVANLTQSSAAHGRDVANLGRGSAAHDRDVANLTRSSGAHDRNPAWSPDGRQLAWLSDESGEYQLFIGDANGRSKPRTITLPANAYYSALSWSPDGTHLFLRDNHLNLWLLELASKRATRIDADHYDNPERQIDAAVWSPDSRWIAYSKNGANHLRSIHLYSLSERRTYVVTDGEADAISPAFDASGAYLYFLASTNYGPNVGWYDLSSLEKPATRTVHAVVLSANDPPPTQAAASPPARATMRVDTEGLARRIVRLDIPAADYANLIAGASGTIFLGEHTSSNLARLFEPSALRLHRHELRPRRATQLLDAVRSFSVSGDGRSLVYQAADGRRWGVVPADASPVTVGDGALDLTKLTMQLDPRAEWANIFRETWRFQRDYFYEPGMHGADWQAIYRKYSSWLPHVNHRADLGYLIAMTGGELSVGHSALSGQGDVPRDEPVNVGMLGADYTVEHGRYRIGHIYMGDPWDPKLHGPLGAPGVAAAKGDYLLEVNGKALAPPATPYSLLEGTVGKPTQLRVSRTPSGDDSRVVTVVPIASEEPLRTHEDWVQKNRRLVERLSGGRLAYTWLPNTGPHGHTAFNRELYAQLGKWGVIVDVRYNQGGFIADSVVNMLRQVQVGRVAMRDGALYDAPIASLPGPRVMVVNESSGSGGDALPYYFKLAGLGPVVGTRTWGGLVGSSPLPSTLDGGGISVPSSGFYDMQGQWLLENEGFTPDIVVENAPAEVIAGRDPQLERAVQEALRMLEQNPVRPAPRPAPANRVSKKATDSALEHAQRLLEETILIDGHNDLPWALRSDLDARGDPAAYDLRRRAPGQTDLERLREGRVGAQFWSVYVPGELPGGIVRTQLEQIDLARRIIARYPEALQFATTAADVRAAHRAGRIASLLGMEGGHAIESSLGTLRTYYDLGVRYLTLTHNTHTDWADSAGETPVRHHGLTPFGEQVVQEMNRLGMLVDLSHTSPETMEDALRVSRAPVIFSHSSARALCDLPRNVPDNILRMLPKNGGVVMVTFVAAFVDQKVADAVAPLLQKAILAAREATSEEEIEKIYKDVLGNQKLPTTTIAKVADHIEHVRRVAGIEHVGLGSDYDGNDLWPKGMEDVSSYPKLFAELIRRGWTDQELKMLAGENVLRALEQAERVAAEMR